MNFLAGLTLDGIIGLLKGIGIIKDPEQEARAKAALLTANSQFLASTSGPIYSWARVILIFASIWDVYFNQGTAFKATGLDPRLELIPQLWLFFGPEIIPVGLRLLEKTFVADKPKAAPVGGGVKLADTDRG